MLLKNSNNDYTFAVALGGSSRNLVVFQTTLMENTGLVISNIPKVFSTFGYLYNFMDWTRD
jgi:hypothetical protein